MLNVALILFLLGALGGLTMAVRIFRGQQAPGLLAAGHGALVATGLVLLIIALIMGSLTTLLKVALVLLLIAALGGFYLLSFHLRRQAHPRAVVVVHALVAVVGVALLVASIAIPA